MKIIKGINLILIMIICTYLGVDKSKRYQKREIELKNIKNSFNIFKTKINYTYETVKDIFKEISKLVYQNNENFFGNTIKFSENNLNINDAWNESIEKTLSNLSKEDKEILNMFGKTLGKTDKDGQISQIELANEFLDKQILLAEEERKKNGKMYKTLGITIGLTLVIIFV